MKIFNPDTTSKQKLLSLIKLFVIIGLICVTIWGSSPYDIIASCMVISHFIVKSIIEGDFGGDKKFSVIQRVIIEALTLLIIGLTITLIANI